MIYTDPYTGEKRYQEDIFDDYQVGLGSNSWYIKKPLKESNCLFKNDNENLYAHAYICKCGHIEINPYVEGNYRCSECENVAFFDVLTFDRADHALLANIDEEAKLELGKSTATIRLFVRLPEKIDLVKNTVIFDKREVYTLSISLSDGSESETGRSVNSDIVQYAHHRLLAYIAKNYLRKRLIDYDKYFLDKTYPQLRKGVLFFLMYPDLKFAEFLKWPMDRDMYDDGAIKDLKTPEKFIEYVRGYRTEKSIKRVVYRRYLSEISVGKFDALTPFVICRVFKDPNHICRLLGSKLVLEYRVSSNVRHSASSHISLIEFLLKFYTEKQLVMIFESIGVDAWLWEDSSRMINVLNEDRITMVFTPPRANMRAIHDALVHARELAENNDISVQYSFDKEVHKPCGLWQERYEVILPADSGELTSWSQILKNCLYSYVVEVYEGNTVIYGIKMNGEMTYAIEVNDGQIRQFKAKYNAEPDEKAKKAIGEWYRHFFIVDGQNYMDNDDE